MKQKILDFLKVQNTPFFSLEANGNMIAQNRGKTASSNMHDAETLIAKALEFAPDGAKLVIKCLQDATVYNSAAIYETFNTPDGKPLAVTAVETQPANPIDNNAVLQAYMAGMQAGAEKGTLLAKLESIEKRLADKEAGNDAAARFDLQTVIGNLSGTDLGQRILAAGLEKFGGIKNL